MKVLKYIGQILASIIYSNLFTGIMYLVIVLPLAFIISLPWWAMLLVIFLGGGLIEAIITILGGIGLAPFFWIVKKNAVAYGISLLFVVFNLGRSTWMVWQSLVGNGWLAIVFGIVVTIMMLQLMWTSIMGITGAYHGIMDE